MTNDNKQPAGRLAVLVSGTGTLLEAILAAGLPVVLVVADRECRGLDIARDAGVESRLIDRLEFGFTPGAKWDRDGYTKAVASALSDANITLVAMAGFMTIFSASIFKTFHNRILNTHPSLLPDFRGHDAVQQALNAGVSETGCTIHIATSELDNGRILAQGHVPVMPGDTAPVLQERIKTVERVLYPKTIQNYLSLLHR